MKKILITIIISLGISSNAYSMSCGLRPTFKPLDCPNGHAVCQCSNDYGSYNRCQWYWTNCGYNNYYN